MRKWIDRLFDREPNVLLKIAIVINLLTLICQVTLLLLKLAGQW